MRPNENNTHFVEGNVKEMAEQHHEQAVRQKETLQKRYGKVAGGEIAERIQSGDKALRRRVNADLLRQSDAATRRVRGEFA